MNKRMHNEQNNAAHKMDAGGKWETMNLEWPKLHVCHWQATYRIAGIFVGANFRIIEQKYLENKLS